MAIKDSGNRTEFSTGAVRDVQEGKGRCDLMPLDVAAGCYANEYGEENPVAWIFGYLAAFLKSGDVCSLYGVLSVATQESDLFDGYEDMLLETSIHFEEGAKKYGEQNWQKGIPVQRYIDSAVRHLLKHLRGDKDEPHDRAFCWNIICAIWTCKHKPELNNYLPTENSTSNIIREDDRNERIENHGCACKAAIRRRPTDKEQ